MFGFEDNAHRAGPNAVQDAVITQNQAKSLAGLDPPGLIFGQKAVFHQRRQQDDEVCFVRHRLPNRTRQTIPIFGEDQ